MITNVSSLQTIPYLPLLSTVPCKIQNVWNSFKESIGGVIRNAFFLPLASKLSTKNQARIQKEILFCKDFWNAEKPLNPQLPHQESIRKHFTSRKETTTIEMDQKTFQVEYSVIESKNASSKEPQNLVLILGSTSTLDNNIIYAYPFLASYVDKADCDSSIAPIRVIAISQYSTLQKGELYRAKTLDESGQILTQTLKNISQEKGPILQIAAHSLGTIILAAALKYAAYEKNVLPSNIYFDRGPASIEKASYKKLGDLAGWVTWKLAQMSGWDIDLGLEIRKHLAGKPHQNIIISEVPHDSHFGGVSLKTSPHLEDLDKKKGFHKLSFDFADQLNHLVSHHNMHNGFLDGHHLLPRDPHTLKNNENMTDKLLAPFTKSSPSIFYPLTYLRGVL